VTVATTVNVWIMLYGCLGVNVWLLQEEQWRDLSFSPKRACLA